MRSLFRVCVLVGTFLLGRTAGAQSVAPLPKTETLPYEAGQPVPPGYHVVEHSNAGVVVAGSLLFGITWATTATVALAVDTLSGALGGSGHEADLLLLPVFGPYLFMYTQGEFNSLLAFDGLAQAAGIGMIIQGANAPTVELVKDGLTIRAAAPMALTSGGGMMLSGTF